MPNPKNTVSTRRSDANADTKILFFVFVRLFLLIHLNFDFVLILRGLRRFFANFVLLFATSNAYRLPPEERIYKNTPVVFSTAGDFYLGWFATLYSVAQAAFCTVWSIALLCGYKTCFP